LLAFENERLSLNLEIKKIQLSKKKSNYFYNFEIQNIKL